MYIVDVDEGLLSLYLNAHRHCSLAAAERTVKAHTFTFDACNLCVIGTFAHSIIGRIYGSLVTTGLLCMLTVYNWYDMVVHPVRSYVHSVPLWYGTYLHI